MPRVVKMHPFTKVKENTEQTNTNLDITLYFVIQSKLMPIARLFLVQNWSFVVLFDFEIEQDVE